MRTYPDYIIAGEQKCGTTSLNRTLGKHPNIFSPTKEVHFFDRHYNKGKKWYKKQFSDSHKSDVCGEKTPNYLYIPECLNNLQNLIPKVKLIIMLRDPVDRAVSYHRSNKELYPLSFSEAINEGLTYLKIDEKPYNAFNFLHRGIYVNQLKKCFDLFPKENILVIVLEQLLKSKRKYLNHIQNFIGVKRKKLEFLKVNVARRKDKASHIDRSYLKEFYKIHNENLFNLLGYKVDEWE